ncbi:beta-hexosaminidase subunit beta [Patella vulgata]|uniref:beta-hexosaminidase subunit beta n=1 Tax=Patella vulgata TaxID=6465 RepID=UPI00217F812D|nr:beta-hexosaminidase subunit beta [Patella vulgata]XP_050410911.1 beta-hexosaminidase subunit beta [Patella vulgata]
MRGIVLSWILGIVLLIPVVNGWLTANNARSPLLGTRPPPGSPWPMPKEWNPTSDLVTFDPDNFRFNANLMNCDIVIQAIKRYTPILFGYKRVKKAEGLSPLPELKMTISSNKCDKYPSMAMDESYELSVSDTTLLTANQVWGMLRGLETFSQLMFYQDGQIFMNKTRIIDSPRFSYRGLHTDTARHYIPLPILKTNLDAMSYNKFNVFHWHIVDDQSFPFVSKTFPELSKKGAYTSKHVYKPEDVADIIEYARVRGIRVIPEFDTPGHTHSWGKAYPDLLTPCYVNGVPGTPIWGKYAAYENFDVTKEFVYEFLGKFFAEVKEVFHDEYIHMGMDESYYRCWQSNPNITTFMQERGIEGNYSKLEQYYAERTLRIISDLGRKYVIWQDPVENGAKVRDDTLVMVWKGGNTAHEDHWNSYMEKIAPQGYNTILASCWYLNYIKYPPDWEALYSCDPHDFNGTQAEKGRVLGGETCMWAEYVDGTNILPRYWPRASSVAERLWSPKNVKNTTDAMYRIDQQRCRMVRRGIPAEPILDGFCGDYDWGFDDVDTPEVDKPPTCTGGFRLEVRITLLLLPLLNVFVL